ncbi:MATE family efflux transporter [Clostridium perfringens]|uniref:MATE family efflux transporter n=1 Tax=Clostridium perfringens TaxID=1502 RepID=UPI001ABBB863|nr:MATE family efflux transporter [Clostridium perfringens]MBO3333416.1 MATE family efflux transporter [Clostridium perfringens]
MKKIDLTKGKVLSVLTTLALPIMGSSFLQFAYGLIDMFWVGGLGSSAVASIGSSSFFLGLGYSINALVVTGTGIKVSHEVGRKNEIETEDYIRNGLIMNFLIGLIYALVLVAFGKGFIGFLNLNDPLVERDSYIYLAVSAPVLFFSFFNYLFTRILASFGNNKLALKISATGIILNMILDPILIYVFKLGVFGAAVATLLANILMFFMYIYYGKGIFKIDLKKKVNYEKVREIARLGFPMASQRVLFTLVNIILARIIASFGADAIAAQKIGLQIESVSFMVIGGLNGAIAGFTGQNYGAKKLNRVNEGYKKALLLGAIYSLLVSVLFICIPGLLVGLFVKDEATIIIGSSYLRVLGIVQIFSSFEMISNGVFSGLGLPKIPSAISIIFTMLRIPMSLVLVKFLGINGVWWSIAISNILKGSTSCIIYRLKIYRNYIV